MKYLVAAIACVALAAPAFADDSTPPTPPLPGQAIAEVFVAVNPNVTLLALDEFVDLGTVQTGVFQGHIPWRVDANTQNVLFWAAASGLYKGDDPTEPSVPPIAVDEESGIQITIPDGGPVRGEDEFLDYTGGTTIEAFPALETESVEYESSQVGHLSQDIDMYVWWNQDDPEKPIGEYGGMVRLSAMIVLF